MAGGVADAQQPIDPGQPPHQRAEAALDPVIGVHVLAEQGDLARAGVDKRPRLGFDIRRGTGDLRAAGVGDHAEGAELVAALLDGEEGADAFDRPPSWQGVELGFGLELHRHRRLAAPAGRGDQLRQAVVALRADDNVDRALALGDLGAFGLGHAAGNRDQHAFPPGARLLAQGLQPAELGIDLLRRPFADVAGVEHHEVGVLGPIGHPPAVRAEQLGHPLAVVDVHLAAVALDEEPPRRGRLTHPTARRRVRAGGPPDGSRGAWRWRAARSRSRRRRIPPPGRSSCR